jgi:hypothetical protein
MNAGTRAERRMLGTLIADKSYQQQFMRKPGRRGKRPHKNIAIKNNSHDTGV